MFKLKEVAGFKVFCSCYSLFSMKKVANRFYKFNEVVLILNRIVTKRKIYIYLYVYIYAVNALAFHILCMGQRWFSGL